jgi:hypothetical protein
MLNERRNGRRRSGGLNLRSSACAKRENSVGVRRQVA